MPSSVVLAETIDVPAEVDGASMEPGAEEAVGEEAPGTGASGATRLPEVHGKFF